MTTSIGYHTGSASKHRHLPPKHKELNYGVVQTYKVGSLKKSETLRFKFSLYLKLSIVKVSCSRLTNPHPEPVYLQVDRQRGTEKYDHSRISTKIVRIGHIASFNMFNINWLKCKQPWSLYLILILKTFYMCVDTHCHPVIIVVSIVFQKQKQTISYSNMSLWISTGNSSVSIIQQRMFEEIWTNQRLKTISN